MTTCYLHVDHCTQANGPALFQCQWSLGLMPMCCNYNNNNIVQPEIEDRTKDGETSNTQILD